MNALCLAGMQHVHALARNISGLMDGSCNPDPAKFGLTSDDERINSSAPNVRHSLATTLFIISKGGRNCKITYLCCKKGRE